MTRERELTIAAVACGLIITLVTGHVSYSQGYCNGHKNADEQFQDVVCIEGVFYYMRKTYIKRAKDQEGGCVSTVNHFKLKQQMEGEWSQQKKQ